MTKREPTKPEETNYDDLLNLDTFSSGIQMSTPAPVSVQPEVPLEPVQTESIPEEPKPQNNYGNFDFLDNIAQPENPPKTTDTTSPSDNILDFGVSDPVTQTQPELVSTENNYNFDLLGGNTENLNKTESKPPVQMLNNDPLDGFSQKEPEFLPDDTIWLNERELDNSGRDGIKVFGKWFLKVKTKLFLWVTIWNKGNSDYRSPRLDIKDNYYGVLFLKDGVGVPLNSIKAGEFITIEKGK